MTGTTYLARRSLILADMVQASVFQRVTSWHGISGTSGVIVRRCATSFPSILAKIRRVDGRARLGAWCGPMKTPEVREARRLFLFGNGDGRRVLKVERLAELAGCTVDTIRRHLPAWEREAEEIAANSSETGIQLRLNKLALAKFESDRDFIRGQIDLQEAEIKQLTNLAPLLLEVVKRISDANPDAGEAASALLSSFFDTVANRKAMEAHLLKLQSHWSRMAGIESLQAVAETREKTLATGRAKLALRREEAGDAGAGDGSAARPVTPAGGVFAKRAAVVEVPRLATDEDV